MKKIVNLTLVLIMIVILGGCSNPPTEDEGFGGSPGLYIDNPWTQEYVVKENNIKGNVDIEMYSEIDATFEIGADKNGYAVFKDPQAAFDTFVEKYNDEIHLIHETYDLQALSQENYATYKNYGAQMTTETKEEQERTHFISKFLDIYENSFDDKTNDILRIWNK